jgi:hypothetical protein
MFGRFVPRTLEIIPSRQCGGQGTSVQWLDQRQFDLRLPSAQRGGEALPDLGSAPTCCEASR